MPRPEPIGLPKLKGILFGDDNWGTVLDEEPAYKNPRGIEMKRYLVAPGEHLMKQYPHLQKPGALTFRNEALWVEYPAYYVEDSNPSRTNAIVRIDCGFDGRETPLTKRHQKLQKEIDTLREELESAQISNLVLAEENRKLLSEIKVQMKEINEITQIARGGVSSAEETNPYEKEGE